MNIVNLQDPEAEFDEIRDALVTASTDYVEAATKAQEELIAAVQSARTANWSYKQIGEVLGVSRQAAWERFNGKVQ